MSKTFKYDPDNDYTASKYRRSNRSSERKTGHPKAGSSGFVPYNEDEWADMMAAELVE